MEQELPDGLGARFGGLSDLPESLVKQIPAARIDDLEREIIDVVKIRFEGVASVDEVLVGLYRQTGIVHDRKKIAGKLYRMVQSRPPLLQSVEGKRGVYRLP